MVPFHVLEHMMVWFLGSLRQPILALEPSSGGEIFGKLRLCTTRYFHQVRNCNFVNSNVIENMRALAKLENLSKNVKIASQIHGFKHVVFS